MPSAPLWGQPWPRRPGACVDLQSDGDLLACSSALWTAAHHQIPLLMVMHNNRSLYNSEEHAEEVARLRGRPVANKGIGTRR
jgi:thiamine pyrophosphate-dependent acetolactate synthase large subunit-like protein